MVKGQLPGPMELPQPKAPPTPQRVAPQPVSRPASPPARPKPQPRPQSVSQFQYVMSAAGQYAISAARQKVNSPAVMLLVTSGLGVAFSLMSLFIALGANNAARSANSAEGFGTVMNLVQLAASGFVFFGALKMKNLESRGLAMAASIVAIVPCFTSCFFAIPAGIWALVVLSKADVKAAFR